MRDALSEIHHKLFDMHKVDVHGDSFGRGWSIVSDIFAKAGRDPQLKQRVKEIFGKWDEQYNDAGSTFVSNFCVAAQNIGDSRDMESLQTSHRFHGLGTIFEHAQLGSKIADLLDELEQKKKLPDLSGNYYMKKDPNLIDKFKADARRISKTAQEIQTLLPEARKQQLAKDAEGAEAAFGAYQPKDSSRLTVRDIRMEDIPFESVSNAQAALPIRQALLASSVEHYVRLSALQEKPTVIPQLLAIKLTSDDPGFGHDRKKSVRLRQMADAAVQVAINEGFEKLKPLYTDDPENRFDKDLRAIQDAVIKAAEDKAQAAEPGQGRKRTS